MERQLTPPDDPTLFALECIYSEGFDLFEVQSEDRTLTHSLAPEERFQFPLPPLRVGRGFQHAFFDTVVMDKESLTTISREHFQIWAEDAMDCGRSQVGPGDCRVGVILFIANLSGNGTSVNDRCLQSRGEQCELHDGDIITLSRDSQGPDGPTKERFLQFHFDLSRSCLREASRSERRDVLAMRTPRLPLDLMSPLGLKPRELAQKPVQPEQWPDVDVQRERRPSQSEAERMATTASAPVFALRAEGPAVPDHLPDADRILAFSPPKHEDPTQLYSSLVVGTANQLDFWEKVIDAHAMDHISREHFEIQTWKSDSEYSFLVRNLSDDNPIRIQGNTFSVALAFDEKRHLLDGDRIIMNKGQDHHFWFTFNDLTRPAPPSVDLGEKLGRSDAYPVRNLLRNAFEKP